MNDPNSSQGGAPAPPKPRIAREYKLVALRDCPLPESLRLCDTPDRAAEY